MPGFARGSLSPIGLDIREDRVSAVQLWTGRGRAKVVAASDFERRESGPLGPEEAERIAAVLARTGFAGVKVVVSAPDESLLTATILPDRKAGGTPAPVLARTEFARTRGCNPQALELAVWPIPPSVRSREQLHLLAMACSHEAAHPLLDSLEAGGLDPISLEPAASALMRSARPLATGDGILCAANLTGPALTVDVAFTDVLVYHRRSPAAGVNTARDEVATDLGLDERCAAHLLAAVGVAESAADAAPLAGAAGRHLDAWLDRVLTEIGESRSYARHRYPDAEASRVLLAGAGANLPGIAAAMGGRLGAEVVPVTPGAVVDVGNEWSQWAEDARLAVALGLAMRDREATT